MASPTDALRAKTDAELQFFVDNPSFYHADIVAAARRELTRRGPVSAGPTPVSIPRPPSPTPPAAAKPALPAAYPASAYDLGDAAAAASRRPLLWVAAVVLVLAGVWLWQKRTPAVVPLAISRPHHLSPDSLKLVEVAIHPLPSYDTDPIVATQLARIPAAEKQQAASLRQFRELCRRFWAAETQTEFLTNQAHAGQAGNLFADQALAVRGTWRDWNKAVVYSYDFGPKMKDQFERMGQVASSQQHILDRMPGLLPSRKFLTDKELVARETDVQDLMRGIRPTSPVTGRPYRATVLQMKP
jgi:hypothetical protein